MKREEIIALAREADDWAEKHLQCTGEYHPDYHDVRDERFAALVAAHEREDCAKVVQINAEACDPCSTARAILESNAAAIRARGNHV